jgi:phosphate transport system permease protein
VTAAAPPGTPPRPRLHGGRGRFADPAFRAFTTICGASVLGILAWMIISTSLDAWPVFQKEGLGFFTGNTWRPGTSRSEITGTYQARDFLWGTFYTSVIALAFAVPLAVGIALYLTELAPRRLKGTLTNLVDLLAGIPSVVYGLWGIIFLLPVMRPVMFFIADTLGRLIPPVFGGPVQVRNYFLAGLVLGIMILPIISAVSREVIATVPVDERNAAFGLGATRWEVMKHVVLPRARAGIIGATMLGLGRALGETIAVLLLVGGSARLDTAVFGPGQTIAGQIASQFRESSPEAISGLVALGVALFLMTIVVNVAARLIVSRLGHVTGDAAL